MKKLLFLFFLIVIHLKAEIVVVANESFPLVRLEEGVIKKIFLRQQQFIEGVKVVPFNLSIASDTRKKFESKIFNMDQLSLKSYWMERHYDGLRPPKQVSSVSAMKQYILNVNGAIGYIPKSELSSDVKEIIIKR